MNLDAILRQTAARLGLRVYLVGGVVRDRCLGIAAHDIDVVVDGDALLLAEAVARATGGTLEVFRHFGTAHLRVGPNEIEFVSPRAESYAPDSRKPEVRPATLMEDLLRRDFTINAMLMDLDGTLHDPLGGMEDLRARILRTPSDPLRTFADDPLRMLRAARFVAQLGFHLAPGMEQAMQRCATLLRPPKVAVERTTQELSKLLVAAHPAAGLEVLRQGGLLPMVLPEMAATIGVRQAPEHHHLDVWEHTLAVVEGVPPEQELRLAALLHDVAKPLTAGPGGTFHGHETVGTDLAREILRRLRFPDRVTDRVSRLIRLHMRPHSYRSEWSDGAVRRLVRDAGDDLAALLTLARADAAASRHPQPELYAALEARCQQVGREQLTLPINGHDIMAVCSVGPGPMVGRVLAALTEAVIDGRLPRAREVLLAEARCMTAMH